MPPWSRRTAPRAWTASASSSGRRRSRRSAYSSPPAFQASGGKDLPLCEGAYEPTYSYQNFALEQLFQETGVDVAVWRSVGAGYTKFAIETFVEEVAAAAGKDPIDFRMKLLEKE